MMVRRRAASRWLRAARPPRRARSSAVSFGGPGASRQHCKPQDNLSAREARDDETWW